MIGERLQDIRKDHNDTQQDLADKLHTSLYAVRCWEQGKSDPQPRYPRCDLQALRRVLRLSSRPDG